MRKLATLFTDSYRTFSHTETITTMAAMGAVSVALGSATIQIGNFIKIGFSSIPNQMICMMFGPVGGSCFAGAMDVVKYMVKPTGPYFPGFTLSAVLAGLLYGIFYYKKPLTLWRVAAAELTVALVCNVLLGTIWLLILHSGGIHSFSDLIKGAPVFQVRAIKNLLLWPVNVSLFYGIARILRDSGITGRLQKPKADENQ